MAHVSINSHIIEGMLGGPAFTEFLTTYNLAIQVMLATVTIIIILLLLINITKLSMASDNDRQRSEAIRGVCVCLVCLGIAGGIDTFFALLLNFVFQMGG